MKKNLIMAILFSMMSAVGYGVTAYGKVIIVSASFCPPDGEYCTSRHECCEWPKGVINPDDLNYSANLQLWCDPKYSDDLIGAPKEIQSACELQESRNGIYSKSLKSTSELK